MAKVPLIHNPASAGGRGASVAHRAVALLAARGVEAEPCLTRGPGDARRIAHRLALEGATRILALGGDGTASEVADGVLASGAEPEVGFLPAGTGNDFLLAFGVRGLEDAVARIAGPARRVDAMRARFGDETRHALSVFGTGFMANVADYANRRLKALGPRGYTLAVFPQVIAMRAPVTRLDVDGVVVEGALALVGVCNTRYAGGAMDFAPMASPDDGVLEVVALRRTGRAKLALRMLPLLLRGKHIGHPDVIHLRGRRVGIEPSDASPLLADGEVFGRTPVVVETLPGALRLLA